MTLEYVPRGDEAKAEVVGTMILINDGTGTPDVGNYWVDFHELGDGQDGGTTRILDGGPFRIEGWPRRRKAWDLVFAALRRQLSWRNPFNGFPRDEKLYVRHKGRYVPVAPFEGFPCQGVHMVYTDGGENPPTVRRASFRWIGDIPEADAMTHAAAQVHHDRACKALMDMKNRHVGDTLEITRRLNGGEPLYRWTEPSIGDVVDCVLKAIADGELEREEMERRAHSHALAGDDRA